MIEIRCQTEDGWRRKRRESVGGSDSAAILEEDPYSSALAKYASKVSDTYEDKANEAMEWGHRHEATIREKVAELFGPVEHEPFLILGNEKLPWMSYSPDGILRDAERVQAYFKPDHSLFGPGLLEIKTADAHVLQAWDEKGLPMAYRIQVNHGLAVTEWGWAVLAALIGGKHFRVYLLKRNQELIDEIVAATEDFWEMVEARQPPSPDGSAASRAALQQLYPVPTEPEPIMLPIEASRLRAQLVQLKEAKTSIEQKIADAENKIRAWIGDHQAGLLPDQSGGWTYKIQNRKAHAVAASSSRVLRWSSKL